jgi:ferredoxin
MITLHKTICFNCGACSDAYPDIFEIKENGQVNFVKDINQSKIEKEIEGICIMHAISVEK